MSNIVYVVTDGTHTPVYAGTDGVAALIYGRPLTPGGHNVLTTYLDGRLWDLAPVVDLYSDHFTVSDDPYQRCAACGRRVGWDGHPNFHHYPFPV